VSQFANIIAVFYFAYHSLMSVTPIMMLYRSSSGILISYYRKYDIIQKYILIQKFAVILQQRVIYASSCCIETARWRDESVSACEFWTGRK